MKEYGGVDVEIHVFLTSALVGEWSDSRPGHFTPRERDTFTRWKGGWVGPITGLDDVIEEKSCPHRDSNSDPSIVHPVASRYTD
jgi:hypothetical protein